MRMARRSELGRAMQTYAAGKATGPRALVVAVVGYAARDALDGDAAAARFLLSADYRSYLELIGLPGDWLPAGVTRAGLVELAGSSGRQIRTDMRICRNMSQSATD